MPAKITEPTTLTWPSPPFIQPDQRHRETVDALGDAGGVHQRAGHDEERHAHQREGIHAVGGAVHHRQQRDVLVDEDEEHRRPAQRQRDREADRQQQEEGSKKEGHSEGPPGPASINSLVLFIQCRTMTWIDRIVIAA